MKIHIDGNMKINYYSQIKRLRTEDVVHFTGCKVHWDNVIVILGYTNDIDLIKRIPEFNWNYF